MPEKTIIINYYSECNSTYEFIKILDFIKERLKRKILYAHICAFDKKPIIRTIKCLITFETLINEKRADEDGDECGYYLHLLEGNNIAIIDNKDISKEVKNFNFINEHYSTKFKPRYEYIYKRSYL